MGEGYEAYKVASQVHGRSYLLGLLAVGLAWAVGHLVGGLQDLVLGSVPFLVFLRVFGARVHARIGGFHLKGGSFVGWEDARSLEDDYGGRVRLVDWYFRVVVRAFHVCRLGGILVGVYVFLIGMAS